LRGSNVQSIVIEVPVGISDLSLHRRIGVWATTKLATDAGGWQQINREGHPMIWPIFWPDDSGSSSEANITHPADDLAHYGPEIAELVAGVVGAEGTASDPKAFGSAIASQLFPDVLSYEVDTASAAVTDLIEFEDRGHSLTIDSGWREVPACLVWLDKHDL
jgi:hypothetical protein